MDDKPTLHLNLGNTSLTLSTLEEIINILNVEGKITIMNAAPTSLMELSLSLLAHAKRLNAI